MYTLKPTFQMQYTHLESMILIGERVNIFSEFRLCFVMTTQN